MGKIYSIGELSSLVRPLLSKYGMDSAKVFGSYARGEATEQSDIDLLLIGRPGFRALDVYGVGEELRRLSGKDVDVYELSELDEGRFRTTILEQAVAL